MQRSHKSGQEGFGTATRDRSLYHVATACGDRGAGEILFSRASGYYYGETGSDRRSVRLNTIADHQAVLMSNSRLDRCLRNVRRHRALAVISTLAFFWVLLRAVVQSITIDEATTYHFFLTRDISLVWAPSSNNHLLNSFLMYVSIHLFGTSNLTARLPAILGAALYITGVARLSRIIGRTTLVQLTSFICLACNPFILDFLVAARGYSLALGFFTTSVVLTAQVGLSRNASAP